MTDEELREKIEIVLAVWADDGKLKHLPIVSDNILALIREAGYRSIEGMADLHEQALGSAMELLRKQGWKSPEECYACGFYQYWKAMEYDEVK